MATHEKTIQELRLEIQELRQFCIMLILNTPDIGTPKGLQVGQATKDYWWELLGTHPKVEVKENLMDCCSGGPQWGHAWTCPKAD